MATEPARAPAPQLNSTPTPAPPRRAASPPAPSLRPAAMRAGQPAVRLTAGGRAPDVDRARAAAEVIRVSGAGAPLPAAVQATLEKSFNADLSVVRVHTDARAAGAADSLSARAFTYGNHIVLGSGQQPTDLGLMAHEVAHVVQQRGAPAVQLWAPGQSDTFEREAQCASVAALGGASFVVHERTSGPQLQRLGISDALDYFADKANNIPGFRMFTIILGLNPINMSRVERSAANIMRAIIEFIPGGGLITQALDNYGIFDRVGNWVEQQIQTLGMTGSALRQAIMDFIDSLSWRDIFDLGGVWERAKRIFTDPIGRIISFGKGLVTGIIRFVKDAILRPLASLAEGTRGYDLLKAVLGQDPITGEPVPRNADTLIGGFMKLIGQEEVWNNLKRANAVARAWAWFQGALSGLMGFVRQIPSLFISALQQLELLDIVLVPRAFLKIARVFGGFATQFFSWAGQQVMSLLQIIFEVVAPGAMPYIRRAAGAFRMIIQNPIGFIGNLVRAGIQGFRQFASRFLTHLRTSLISWLTGTMSGASIYIPQAFTLREILKFVLSVLGLTWQNIRGKLVRAIGETAVRVLEAGFDIVVTLVTQGPAAAWEKIQEGISNLRDMVMEQVMTFVRDRVVQAAITKLLTSLNPAGAFIQAVIAIYNTIMFFVERLRQIAQVAMSFIDSIAAIASGAIGSAANRVEQTMAGLLTLVISFLARIAGLGRVSDAVINIVNRVRQPIDRALDRVVEWIVNTARRLGRLVVGVATPGQGRDEGSTDARLVGAIAAAQQLMTKPEKEEEAVEQGIPTIVRQFGLRSLRVVKDHEGLWHAEAEINPRRRGEANPLFTRAQLTMLRNLGRETARQINARRADGWPDEYRRGKRAFLLNADRVVVGRPVESAGAAVVEEIAMDAGLSVLRNVALQFLDANGDNVGGLQHELDFVIVGKDRITEIISAKTNPAQLDVRGDRGKLVLMRNVPSRSQQLREYAIQNFLGRGRLDNSPWNRVTDAVVVFSDRGEAMRMPLSDFRTRYLLKTPIEQLRVRSLSPAQPTGGVAPDIALRANTNELLDQLIKFIDASL